jgi:hypothetical protein
MIRLTEDDPTEVMAKWLEETAQAPYDSYPLDAANRQQCARRMRELAGGTTRYTRAVDAGERR